MEQINSFTTCCIPGRGQTVTSFSVEYKNEYKMKSHRKLHYAIEETWQNKLKQCSILYNASKFRLHGIITSSECKPLSGVKFLLGPTCYKDYIGTHFCIHAEQLYKDGLENFSDSQSYLANPLGVGGVLVSDDDNLILMKRSAFCAEQVGMIDFPGGHPEPDEVKRENGASLESIDTLLIVEEIFNSVLKEIRDEVNVPLQYLSPPSLLGVSYDLQSWKRPSALFYVRSSLNSNQILKLYAEQNQAEKEESTELILIPLSMAMETDLEKLKYYDKFTPSAKSGIMLLKYFLS